MSGDLRPSLVLSCAALSLGVEGDGAAGALCGDAAGVVAGRGVGLMYRSRDGVYWCALDGAKFCLGRVLGGGHGPERVRRMRHVCRWVMRW